jgi:hypothetical protein
MFKYKTVFLFLILLTACTENEKINSTKACNPDAEYLSDLDLYAIDNIEKAKACSKESNKPIFTLYSDNRNQMSTANNVFKNNKVLCHFISENFVLVILYVDLQIDLETPLSKNFNGKYFNIKTEGDLNNLRQLKRYPISTQPLFAITNHKDEDVINYETFRTLNDKSFLGFLQKGLKAFNENKSIQKKKIVKPKPIIRVKEIKNRDLFEEFNFSKLDYDTAFAYITNDTLKVTNVFFSVGYCYRSFKPSYTYKDGTIKINSNEIVQGKLEIIGQDTIRTRISFELATLMEFEYTLPLFGIETPTQLFFNEKEIKLTK